MTKSMGCDMSSSISCVYPFAEPHITCFLPLAIMSAEDENLKVFQGTPSEDVRLENLGYEQGMSIEKEWIVL
jgi:hypothetical protein